jgi:aspartate-semialdehyde dehydrogenase
VPIVGHSEAINVEFTNDFRGSRFYKQTDVIVVQDNLQEFEYPMPMYAEGKTKFCWAY